MGHDHGPQTEHDWAAMADLLDLDAEILPAYLPEVTAWLRRLADGAPRRRVLDLGAGTGTATIALAQRFGAAEVIAVDGSEQLLSRVRAKALDLGLAARVRTVAADLDGPWPELPPVDVVWASMSLHHLADPDRVLKDVFATLRPGGLVAVAEMAAPLRFLPDDLGLGRPGLESRCQAALAGERADSLPHLGADWGVRLERAGFALVARREFVLDPRRPYPSSTGRYAQGFFRRTRAALEDRLDADDLATVDALTADDGPASLLRRGDLLVRGTRTGWVARRP